MNQSKNFIKPVFFISVLVPLLYWIPTISGYYHAESSGSVFMGYNRGADYVFYNSLINQTREFGTIISKNLYTTEPQINRNIFAYHVLLGFLARWLDLSALDIPLLFEKNLQSEF